MEIRKLDNLMVDDIKGFGLYGYKTNKIYKVDNCRNKGNYNLSITESDLENEIIKEWPLDEKTLNYYSEIISQGLSYGAYKSNELIGYILMSEMSWNKSLCIDYIMVSDSLKGTGTGRELINKAIETAKGKYRVLSLEVQNENYGAIQFYMKMGFSIEGIEFSKYPEKENEKSVAFIMKYKL